MSASITLWKRPCPALDLPPVFVTGYHLEEDEKYVARKAEDDAALVDVVPAWLPESVNDAAEAVRKYSLEIAKRLIRARKALSL